MPFIHKRALFASLMFACTIACGGSGPSESKEGHLPGVSTSQFAASCGNGVKDNGETATDCGGPNCGACGTGAKCLLARDCLSLVCKVGYCAAPGVDGVQNGDESDVDCGGTWPSSAATGKCSIGKHCFSTNNCVAGSACVNFICAAPSCSDGIRNGDETDVDCGGSCPNKCIDGKKCAVPGDCTGNLCSPSSPGGQPYCRDPNTCTNTHKDGDETGVDCGGSCKPCAAGVACNLNIECSTGICSNHVCQAASCSDGVKNGTETGVDCGGSGSCPRCGESGFCTATSDCQSGLSCVSGICQAADSGNLCLSTGSGPSYKPPVVCSPINGCVAGVCDPLNGQCAGSNLPNGTSCASSDPNSAGSGACAAGACAPTSCNPGYLLSGGSCAPIACAPSQCANGAAAPSSSAPPISPVALPLPAGFVPNDYTNIYVTGISGARMVGYETISPPKQNRVILPLYWADACTAPVVLANNGRGGVAAAIDGTWIVGRGTDPTTYQSLALLWDATAPTAQPVVLGSAAGTSNFATSISGTLVVGVGSGNAPGMPASGHAALLWDITSPSAQTVLTAYNDDGGAVAISGAQIVGYNEFQSNTPGGFDVPVLWSATAPQTLQQLGGVAGNPSANPVPFPSAIDSAWITGWANTGTGATAGVAALVWSLGDLSTPIPLGLPTDLCGSPSAIDGALVVGWNCDLNYNPAYVVWDATNPTGSVPLGLFPSSDFNESAGPSAISGSRIAGTLQPQGTSGNDSAQPIPVFWDLPCAP